MFGITTTILGLALLTPASGVPAIEFASALSVSFTDSVSGQVTSVDLDAKTFSVKADEDVRAMTWNDETSFLLDGEESDAAAVIVEDATVSATVGEDGIATSVSRVSE